MGRPAHLSQKLPQYDEEGHQISCIAGEDALRVVATHVLGRSAHRRCNNVARGVHDQLGQEFEDLLDDLRVRFLQIQYGELNTDI
jgi:hypothetical protein